MIESMIANAHGKTIFAPLRENVATVVKDVFGKNSSFRLIPPMPYLEFGWLTAHALGVITDSGNVAEEATFNGVPCITLNSYTEHIETVKVGSNVLVGEDAEKLGEAVSQMVRQEWKQSSLPDRWDGRSAERIVQILMEYHENHT
jgi:UDP-N-acetylglucosamine 2-epimerase (non-hydrolysing)